VTRARLSESDISGLTESLMQSTFLRRYQSQVCSRMLDNLGETRAI
jgi:hypothetical protein